ncbi:hypothetical protein MIB92_05420 [Aestuariirhabdus sp. Z084]|uniref:phage baseplate protein n=1 Tax=Aestuariirhabdus haliotis TaxID=2918751 RepID=UPI00201B3DCE|nr:hypothetical protein [Aestuariirhabdus haliotis]MCL6415081.1 hypothetical protein [Aestuariirhabdus haliotis]MCL6419013.1 hypothetical protein [Aestuariirhabdus haliotis]
MKTLIKALPFIFVTFSFDSHSKGDVISACTDMAKSALRSFTFYKDDKAFLAASHSEYCNIKQSYNELSSSKKTSFSAVYKRILRLGYGGDTNEDSMQATYEKFCSRSASMFKADHELYSEVSTIRERALRTVELCLASAEANISVNYNTPEKPEDLIHVVFKATLGSQRLLGVGGRNTTCRHGDTKLSPHLESPMTISSEVITITCHRRHEPIKIYGLNGTRYPRAEIVFYTNYSDSALDIILPEDVTGPLHERLEKIESRLALDSVQKGSVVAFVNAKGCPERGWDQYADGEGRTIIGVSSMYPLSHKGGSPTHTLGIPEMPIHQHSTYTSNEVGRGAEHGQHNSEMMHSEENSVARVTGKEGGGQAHNNMQPYVALHYCVKI